MRPSELDPDRWRRIDELLDVVLATPPADRGAFLDEVCAGDQELRAELDALITAHEDSAEFFERRLDDLTPDAFAAAIRRGGAVDELPPDRRIGPFRIDRELGRGGMGVVYLAEDTRLGRHVALKALPPYLGVGPGARERFRSEARAVSRLDHPNIATLYEVGETDTGQLYMVFSYYPGETLAARIARGPLPVEEAIEVTARIADGLSAAHAEGIVHRDVKPSNVLLTETGGVKLLDFGVAKVAGEDVTREGVRPGTAAYMSPEQASGRAVDHRTDLWSLGVVLYEMLTGRRPFDVEHPEALRRAILDEATEPVDDEGEELPDALKWIVRTMLRKSPADRYGDASELLSDLRELQAGDEPAVATRREASRAGAALRRRLRTAALLLLGLVVLVAASVWWRSASADGSPEIRRLAVLPPDDLTGESGREPFLNGVHDALVVELGRLGLFDVVSRASMMQYRDSELSLPQIAAEQQVDALLAASVLREGDSVAVTAQLLALSPERTLWVDRYRRGVGDVFALGSEIARSIAAEVGHGSPDGPDRASAPVASSPEAFDAYNFGVFHLEQRSREGFEQAVRYFQLAIEQDSAFAPAYAALARAYGSGAFFGLGRPSANVPRVAELAETALRLDPSLAEAHTVLSAVNLYWHRDLDAAETRARRAIALNPSFADAHRALSEVLSVTGRYRAALEAVEHASQLEPLLPFSAFRPMVVLIEMRDFDAAIERGRAGLEFHPRFWQGHWLLCLALAGEGRHEEAIPVCEQAVDGSRRLPMALGALGHVLALTGRRTEAEAIVRELEERSAEQYVGGSWVAAVHGALDHPDRAFEWLERAYREGDLQLVNLHHSLLFDPLREDARFDALLERVWPEGRSRPDRRPDRQSARSEAS